MGQSVLTGLIKCYRYTFGVMLAPSCRYFPSCSSYGLQAIEQHGALRGFGLTVWRILRCNPFSSGGLDVVPDRFHISCCGRRWPRT